MRKFAIIAATLALAACSSPAPVEKAPEKPVEPAAVEKVALTPEQEKEVADFKKLLADVKTSNEARKLGRGKPTYLSEHSITRADELQKEENERRKNA